MAKNNVEVIIRSEADYDGNGFHWVAVFPNDPANLGKVSFVAFKVKDGEIHCLEAFDEMTLSWYYEGTKFVKPTVLEMDGVYDAMRKWYADKPDVRLIFKQKMPRDLKRRAWRRVLEGR